MTVFSDNIISIGSNGAVYEFVVVLVKFCKQMKTKIRLTIESVRMAGNGFHYIVRHIW